MKGSQGSPLATYDSLLLLPICVVVRVFAENLGPELGYTAVVILELYILQKHHWKDPHEMTRHQ